MEFCRGHDFDRATIYRINPALRLEDAVVNQRVHDGMVRFGILPYLGCRQAVEIGQAGLLLDLVVEF